MAKEEGIPSDRQRQGRGLLSRMWEGFFGGGGEDFEKRLEHLSREEAVVLLRIKRRAKASEESRRNFVACSVILEIAAVVYAILVVKSNASNWQLRAANMIPMLLLPGLSFGIYSAFVRFTKMREVSDQKTLENLRAERQAKIDELKERTNFYSTQQLIQRYDLDPAAKAAAATVLASRLGADTGLKFFLADAPLLEESSGRSNDIELVASGGLRNRKQSSVGGRITSSTLDHGFSGETTEEIIIDGQQAPAQSHQFVEHYKGPAIYNGWWVARLAAMLVGEDPAQCYALICTTCHMHNGLTKKEDFPYVTYYCPHCRALNSHRQLEGSVPGSDPNSGNPSLHNPGSADMAPESSAIDPSVTQVEESVLPHPGEVERHSNRES